MLYCSITYHTLKPSTFLVHPLCSSLWHVLIKLTSATCRSTGIFKHCEYGAAVAQGAKDPLYLPLISCHHLWLSILLCNKGLKKAIKEMTKCECDTYNSAHGSTRSLLASLTSLALWMTKGTRGKIYCTFQPVTRMAIVMYYLRPFVMS